MAINDTFVGADGALVKDRAGWLQIGATNQPVLNGSGGVRSVDAGSSSTGATIHDTGVQSHFGEAVVGADALSNSAATCNFVCVKAPVTGSSFNNQYNVSYAPATNQLRLRNGSGNLQVVTLGTPLAVGDEVRLEAQMAPDNAAVYLTAKVNGNTVIGPYTATAYLTQTGVGFRAVTGQAQNPIIDSFSADALEAPDTVAPVLASNPELAATGQTSLSGQVTTDEAGPAYAVLYAAALSAPSADQIEAGQNASGGAAVARIIAQDFGVGENAVLFGGGTAGTAYKYSVVQYDAAGNRSNVVTSNSATTQALPSDSTPPVMPGPITIGKKSSGTIAFSFPAGTDNVGVTAYEYRVDAGPWTSLGTTRSGTATALTQLTSYTIGASALDAAGNRSNVITATTTTYRNGATGQYILDHTGPVGGNPAGILFNDVAAGDEDKWFSFTIVTPPAAPGSLAINPDGSFTWTGSAADSFTYQLQVDGTNAGTPQTVSLAEGSASDTTAPQMQGVISLSSRTQNSYTTGVDAATDNVAVTGYRVSQDGGSTWIDKGTSRTHNHTGRTPGATDQVRWSARDAAGNWATPLALVVTLHGSVTVPYVATAEQVWAPALSVPGAVTISPPSLASDEQIWSPVVAGTSAGAQVIVPSFDGTEEFGSVVVTSVSGAVLQVAFLLSDEEVWAPSFSLPPSGVEVEFVPSDEVIWAPSLEIPIDGTGGLYLVTMAQARAHLRSDDTDDNADLELKLMAASEAVVDYLGDYAEAFANSDGTVKEGTAVPKRVQMATLLTIGYLYRERDGSQDYAVPPQFGYGFTLPQGATALLYSLRRPVIA